MKNATLEANQGLADELCGMFQTGKAHYMRRLQSGEAAAQADEALLKMAEIVDGDPIPFGFESNRKTLETFIGYNAEQGVIPEKVTAEELFPASTLAFV